MSSITLSMIVKNEEKYLRGCLESVQGVVDEIVIVDTGSTDSTLEIAKEFNAKIYNFEWINNFSAARNFALSKSTGDWILYLDADERLHKQSKHLVRNIAKKKNKFAVYCSIENILNGKEQPTYMQYTRFFSNSPKIQFRGKAHEQIGDSLKENNYRFLTSKIIITHLGYAAEKNILKQKAKRNLDLLLDEFSVKPSAYLAYQITNSYHVLEDYHRSFEYATKTLEMPGLSIELRSTCYMNIMEYNMNRGNFKEAEKICLKALKENKKNPIVNIIASQIYERLNENEKALEFCKIAFNENNNLKKIKIKKNFLDIILNDRDIILHGLLISLKLQNLIEVNTFLKELKKVCQNDYQLINNLLQNNKIDLENISKVKNLLNDIKLNLIFEIFKYCADNEFKNHFYTEIYEDYKNDKEFLLNYGEFLLNNKELEKAGNIFNLLVSMNINNPSIYFYLVSIYLQTNQFEEIIKTLQKAEKIITIDSPFYNKLKDMKNKLASILA